MAHWLETNEGTFSELWVHFSFEAFMAASGFGFWEVGRTSTASSQKPRAILELLSNVGELLRMHALECDSGSFCCGACCSSMLLRLV